MNRFIGVDLGWYGKPSGLASLEWSGGNLIQRKLGRLEPLDKVLGWIEAEAGTGDAVVAVDAPLVIANESGIRSAERDLNRDFRRFHAGCHAANLSRPFAQHVTLFSRLLEDRGYLHGAAMESCQPGRFQIEVHPHAATVTLFGLERIVKYKRGPRAERARELRRLCRLMAGWLETGSPALRVRLPKVPRTGDIKPAEDVVDAVLCAYVAAHWWRWAAKRNVLYGTTSSGYIVVPSADPAASNGLAVSKVKTGGWADLIVREQKTHSQVIDYKVIKQIAGGEGGIRTHGTRKGSTVFETARFNHSRTSPDLNHLISLDLRPLSLRRFYHF